MPKNEVGVVFVAKDFDPFEKIIKKADDLLIGFNKTIEKTTASMNKLETQIRALTRVQRLSANQYTRATRQAENYGQAVKVLETNVSDLAIRSQSGVGAIGRFESAQSRASESASALTRNLARADTRLRSLNQNLRSGGLTQLGSGMSSAGRGATTLSDNLRGTISKVKELGSSASTSAGKVLDLAGSLAKKAATSLLAFGAASAVAIGATVNVASSFESAFIGVGKTVDGLVEIGEDGFLQMTAAGQNFNDSLQDLTENTLPATFEEAAKVAELGGQLGFVSSIDDIGEAQEALLAFTETIIGLETATDLTAEAAAQDLSRFANIFQDDFDDSGQNIRNIGNTIVELGNTSATTESQIVSFATRLAGAGKAAGLSQADVLGIGAAFSSIGINAEAGGTAVSKVLLEMQKAANATNEGFVDNTEAIAEQERKQRDLVGALRTLEAQTGLSAEAILAQQDAFVEAGGSVAEFGEQLGDTRRRRLVGMIEDVRTLAAETEQLKKTHGAPFSSNLLNKFLKVTGVTTEEFKRLQKEEPAELFRMLIEGIADEGDRAGATLEELGFNTSQLRQAMLGMAQNTDLLTTSLAIANDEFTDGNALAEETEKRYATFDSRMQRFKNTLRGTAADIGSVFLPAIGKMLSGAGPIVGLFGDRIPDVIDSVVGKIGELTGLDVGEFDFATTLNTSFDSLVSLIDSFDVTPVQTAFNTISTDVLPTMSSWLTLVSENWETFESIIVALGTAAGVAVTIAALTSIGATVLALLNPITLVAASVAGLAFVWQTNMGGIQETTATIVAGVTENVTALVDAFDTDGLEGVFDFLEIPEGIQTGVDNLMSTFDDLTIGTSVQDFFDSLGELFSSESMDAILVGLGIVGKAVLGLGTAVLALGTVAVATTLDQLQGLIDIGANLIGFFDSLLELDSADMVASLEGIAEGFLTIAVSPFENIAEAWTGEDLDFVTPVMDALGLAADAIADFIWPILGLPVGVEDGLVFSTTVSGALDTAGTVITDYVWPALPLPTLPDGADALDFAIFISDPLGAASDLITNLVWPEIPLPTIPEGLTEFVSHLTAPFADIEIPESLTNLSAQITDLFSGESAEKISAAATFIGEGIGSLVGALVELATPVVMDALSGLGTGIVTVTGAVASLAAVGIASAIEVVLGLVDAIAAIIGIVDSILDSDMEGATTQVKNFIAAIGSVVLAPLENLAELFTGEDVDLAGAIAEWVDNGITTLEAIVWPKLPEFVWPTLELPTIDTVAMSANLTLISQQIPIFFDGILDDISLGIPEFPDLAAKATEVLQGLKDKFSGFLSDIDIGIPDTLIDIAGAIGIDLGTTEENAKAAGEDVGAAITEGLAKGQTDNAQIAADAASDVSEQTWAEWATSWATGSESRRTMALGKDVIDGFALGLQDTETIIPAVEALNLLVLTGFKQMAETISIETQPALDAFVFALDDMNILTLPTTISLLEEGLIPAKMTLANVNDGSVTPSVDRLKSAEHDLGKEIGKIIPIMSVQINKMNETKSNAEKLAVVIKKLTSRYLSLAAAIAEAGRSGSGVPTGVTGNEPIGTPAVGAFQKGGQFIVPSTIPQQFKTPSGGMLAEVHPGELVTVVTAPQVSAPTAIKDRAISGASMQQDIANVTNNQSKEQSFNLNVTEVVSKDVRTSFGLMQSLGGFN